MAKQTAKKKRLFPDLLSALILGAATGVFAVCALISGNGAEAAEHPVWQPLLRAHDRLSLMLGNDRLGDVYVTEDRLLPHLAEPAPEAVAAAAEAVNLYAASAGASVYVLAVPTAAGVYGDMLPDSAPLTNEYQILRDFSNALQEPVLWIEASSWLSGERDRYIYYRTDAHWTGYGAFCVYRSAIRKLGFTAVGYDRFSIRHDSADYYGRLSQQAHYYDIQPDVIDLYENSSTVQQPERVTAIRPEGNAVLPAYYRTDLPEAKTQPNLLFGTESEPILHLEMDNPGTRHLLLLTDSFGGSMVPFLMQHYHSITAVNLTLARDTDWRSLTADDYSQILILCGTDTVAAEHGLTEMLAEPAA